MKFSQYFIMVAVEVVRVVIVLVVAVVAVGPAGEAGVALAEICFFKFPESQTPIHKMTWFEQPKDTQTCCCPA